MTLSVDVQHRRGSFELQVRFDAGSGVTALFGASGAGKTTLLDLIAGLERPQVGRIGFNGDVFVDTARRVWVAPHRRRIGYVFQDSRLFPHLTVQQNLGYGMRFAARGGGSADFGHVTELLGLEVLLARRPGSLSGGERQRVAIGRALLSSPRLLLLDEPMASLDMDRRREILPYLARVREEAGIPIVYVSHALPEVAKLADSVVLLDAGHVTAVGPVAELLSRLDLVEASQAAKAGAVLTAVVTKEASDPSLAPSTILTHPAGEFHVPWTGQAPGTAVRLHVMARDVALAVGELGTLSIRNRLKATVVEVAPVHGGVREIRLDAGGEALLSRVTAEAVDEMGLKPGVQVTALIKSIALER